MIICPNCGDPIVCSNLIDQQFSDNVYSDYCEGTCPNCSKSWRWVEVFTFDRYEDIEEIENDDHL